MIHPMPLTLTLYFTPHPISKQLIIHLVKGTSNFIRLWGPKLVIQENVYMLNTIKMTHMFSRRACLYYFINAKFCNPPVFMELIELLLKTFSKTFRLIPDWEIRFHAIASRTLQWRHMIWPGNQHIKTLNAFMIDTDYNHEFGSNEWE